MTHIVPSSLRGRWVARALLFFCVCAGLHSALAGSVQPTWFFRDYFGNSYAGTKTVTVTPLVALGTDPTNGLMLGDPRVGHATNSSFSTNLDNGFFYRVEFDSGFQRYAFTNYFGTNVTGAVNGGDPLYRAYSTNLAPGTFALSAAASDGRYLFRVLPSVVGYVPKATDTNGNYTWQADSGGGGGGSGSGNVTGPVSSTANHLATYADGTGELIADSGVPFANLVLLPAYESFTNAFGGAAFKGTNAFDLAGTAIAVTNGFPWGSLYDAAGAAHSATNGFPWGSLYDAAGAAQATTNGMALGTGLAAFRSTNTFAPTNIATALKVGLVKVDNSTITVASDGTIAATTGGGGNVTGTGSSTSGHVAIFNNTSATGISDPGFNTNSWDDAGAAHAATNGFPWGSLYDAVGAAHSATNGFPWGSLYDASGAAHSATNGFPWGTLYDPAGRADTVGSGLTNVINTASNAAISATTSATQNLGGMAFRGTNFVGGAFESNSVTWMSNLVFAIDGTTFVLTGCGDTNGNGVYGYSNAGPVGLIFTNPVSPGYYVVSNLYHVGPVRGWVLTNDSTGVVARSPNTSGGVQQPSDGLWITMNGTNAPLCYFHYTASYANPAQDFFPFEYILIDRFGNDASGTRGPLTAFSTLENAFLYSHTNATLSGITVSNQFPYKYVLDPCTYGDVSVPMPPGSQLIGHGMESFINGRLLCSMSNYVGYLKAASIQINVLAPSTNTIVENVELGTTNAIDCIYGVNLNVFGVTVRNSHFLTCWDATQGIITGTFINVGIDGYGGQTTASTGLHGYNVTEENCNYTIIGGYVNLTGLNTNVNNVFNGSPATNACLWICGTNATVNLYGPSFIHDTNNLAIYNFVGCTNVNGYFFDNGVRVSVSGTNYFKTGLITTTTPVAADYYGGIGNILWQSNQTTFVSGYNGTSVTTVPLNGTALFVNGTITNNTTGNAATATLAGTVYNGSGETNYIAWTHEGTTTNLTAAFNGTLQSYTCTNGPSVGQDYFFTYAGLNGSVSYRFAGSSYNNLHFAYQPKWLAGSNNVITNGVLSLTSYGGTNAAQIEAAIVENQ